MIIIAFRVAYSIGQTVAGPFLDRVGTRTGLSIAVLCIRRRDAHVAGRRPEVVRRVPVPARPRRSGQLAGRNQSGVRVVPAPRERLGGRAVRQRIVDRRGHRAAARPLAVPRVRHVAARLRHHRIVRLHLAVAVPAGVPPARNASVDFGGGTRLHPGRSGADRAGGRPAGADVTPARAAPDVGHHHRQDADRSGVVPHHRLVRHLSGLARLHPRDSLLWFWVPFLAADAGNFLGRRHLEPPDQRAACRSARPARS